MMFGSDEFGDYVGELQMATLIHVQANAEGRHLPQVELAAQLAEAQKVSPVGVLIKDLLQRVADRVTEGALALPAPVCTKFYMQGGFIGVAKGRLACIFGSGEEPLHNMHWPELYLNYPFIILRPLGRSCQHVSACCDAFLAGPEAFLTIFSQAPFLPLASLPPPTG